LLGIADAGNDVKRCKCCGARDQTELKIKKSEDRRIRYANQNKK
jgi:hypothetical protein